MEKNFFVKSHGLGNEYIVLDSENISFRLSDNAIKRLCNIHFGIGSDGVLLKVPSSKADFGLRIFNPDASEAEKSGNGLRIFCKFLYDYGFTRKDSFTIDTPGGLVRAKVDKVSEGRVRELTVDMGKAIFATREIPVDANSPEFIGQAVKAGDKTYEVNCVSVGNPHCVVIKEELNEDEVKHYGPILENHPLFPNRINVQFAKVINQHEAQALIWERGAGYTLASGSSSCAVACVLIKRGLTGRSLTIRMKGGNLSIGVDEEWNIRMRGEVMETANGTLSRELIEVLNIPMVV